jgi:maltose alpha-D-glucosyltransferase/alpha-amylase
LKVSSDELWYKDAIFYELHVKAYRDSDGNGVGDFRGLVTKLDHLTELGVDCIWLLPMYPSPFRDDGYDVSDYFDIHPTYGTLDDFREFLAAAHQRGLRVITELVLNHTSDQNPWFQEAQKSRESPRRNWYVWSDTDERYRGVRVIFTDTENSNWAWDPVSKQYYWHRLFSHQPDLNFDNPEVQEEMWRLMKFWLDMGVDGFRVDAVPYLVEREGTSCENLPETHAILKWLRRKLDENYRGKVLLAEANQWPADVVDYFGAGDGDECHMCFHFPLMPRMFMAVRREQRYPITEILAQTPDIPARSQWGIFLRNHDELTLEMVTDEERDYMYAEYAKDARMKVNLGIRRRLMPLVDNDRRLAELLHAMLFSMPGSPILYYGDEIGMGDNIFLGDRDSVRTPMQWSPDRNAGFSRSDFAQLYLPPLMDPVYGFQSANVEAEMRDKSSFLYWMQHMLQVRQQRAGLFGEGSFEVLSAENPSALAYVRELDGEIVLCVNNLSRFAQPVELNLNRYEGKIPIELLGRVPFPRIGELPYFVTLGPYAFYWFELVEQE